MRPGLLLALVTGLVLVVAQGAVVAQEDSQTESPEPAAGAGGNPTVLPVSVRITAVPGLVAGDCTMDGRTTVADAVAILQYTIGLRSLDSDQLRCADTNNDGRVTVADAVHILQFTVDPYGERDVLARSLWTSPEDDDLIDPLTL